MYSDQDFIDVNRRLRAIRVRWLPALALLLAAFVLALALRVRWLAVASAVALAAAACFGFTFYLLPNLRYRGFLTDMADGLSREMAGSVVEIAEKPESHDGARVLPVRLWLDGEQDERIVYLNVSKRDQFPAAGAKVRLKLYGRHIREVAPG